MNISKTKDTPPPKEETVTSMIISPGDNKTTKEKKDKWIPKKTK